MTRNRLKNCDTSIHDTLCTSLNIREFMQSENKIIEEESLSNQAQNDFSYLKI